MTVAEECKKISFIIPTYNAGEHLERCLKSIRYQDYHQEKVEILIIDGGSSDNTLEIAKNFDCKILNNPKRLAEYGIQLGVKEARGEFLAIFAADNELVGNDWIKKIGDVFADDGEISAVWGRLASGKYDSSLNKYFELIQSDPLNWFLNKNLNRYKAEAKVYRENCFIFMVDPARPLVWGANGLVYKAERIKQIWEQEGYLGDNDAFQYMIEQGNNKVGYFGTPFVYHHHVAKINDWVKKWKRNFIQHLAGQQGTRNMSWVFTGNFKVKIFMWVIYSIIPLFSFFHALYLTIKDRQWYWLYHPLVSFLQCATYAYLVVSNFDGRIFARRLFFAHF